MWYQTKLKRTLKILINQSTGVPTHPQSIKSEGKEPNTLLSLLHTFQPRLINLDVLWMWGTGSGHRRQMMPLWMSQGKTKTLNHHPAVDGKPWDCTACCTWETPLGEQRYLPLRRFKCYSEITQRKHAGGCSASSEGASQQRQQVYVDVPELAANAAQPTKPM